MSKLTDSEILLRMDQMRGIAIEGLNYARNPYDEQRYKQLLQVVADLYGNYLQTPPDALLPRLRQELGSCTPKVGVDVAVRNTAGQLLALRRSDDQTWCLPCGWVGIGETPDVAAARETLEESGLSIRIQGAINISVKGPTKNKILHHQLNILLISEPVDAQKVILSAEHIDSAWVSDINGREWHPGHTENVEHAKAYMDRPNRPILKIRTVSNQSRP